MTHPLYRPINTEDRLTRLMEEAGELVVACAKIKRFGTESKHPDKPDGPTNWDQLIMELNDLETARDDYLIGVTGSPWHQFQKHQEMQELLDRFERYQAAEAEAEDAMKDIKINLTKLGEGEVNLRSSAACNAIMILAMHLKEFIGDAPNYVTTEILSREHGNYNVTVQRQEGISPAARIAELEAQQEWLVRRACMTGQASTGKNRETGMSSNALVHFAFTGKEPNIDGWDLRYPSDVSDLNACYNCYKGAPESVQIKMLPLLLKYIDHIAEKWGESKIPDHIYKLKKDAQKNES